MTDDHNSKRVLRVEDDTLLDGSRHFIDDLEPRGTLHIAMARSPIAHADVLSIDANRARAMPGVHVVLTGTDIAQHSTPTILLLYLGSNIVALILSIV